MECDKDDLLLTNYHFSRFKFLSPIIELLIKKKFLR